MKNIDPESLFAATFPGLKPLRVSGRRCSWWLPLGEGGGTRAGLRVDGPWASLQLQGDRAREPDPVAALAEQAAWPAGVKHAMSGRRPMLRADVPLLMDTANGRSWVAAQLLASSEGMLVASGREARVDPPSREPREPSLETDPEFLAHACAACGWGAVVKPGGAVRIDVVLRDAPWTVMLRAGEAGIRASVGIAAGALARAHPRCRAAAGLLLMQASTALRWARPFIRRDDDGGSESVGFECLVAAPPDERAVLLSVDTLLAACELFGRETEVLLEHPEIAARYCNDEPGVRGQASDVSSHTSGAEWPPVPSPAAHAVGA
jgi:hypothetical protein